MAHRGPQVDQEKISCSICLDLLRDPVTTSCGHSYCSSCIKNHWDTEDQREVYSCPQCRQTFRSRPKLKKNTMLADLVEEMKKTRLQAAPPDHCYAGPEDVACDVCTGRKLKAHKSCLLCLVSFCEEHLQPHFSPAYEKHLLEEPSKKLQHKDHDIDSVYKEWNEKQTEFYRSKRNIQQRIQHRERDVKLLQQEVEAINNSADEAVENSEKTFTEMIRLLEQRRSEVKQQLRSQQQTEVSRVRELQEKLEQEITELKRKDQELEKLSLPRSAIQFLQDYAAVSQIREPKDSPSISELPLWNFEDVTAAVSELRDKLQKVLRGKGTNISETEAQVHVVQSQPELEPRTGVQLVRYSRDITLDPNTVNDRLLLSNENRKITALKDYQPYPDHPDRFSFYLQVLSKESLTGRCYWEVERRGRVFVAVSYKTISRQGRSDKCKFGSNDKSWALNCHKDGYVFWHNNVRTTVSGLMSSRVGVYLDHRAGILSFYRVSDTVTLLHRVQTTFTEPLYAGIRIYDDYHLGHFYSDGFFAEFCKLK